MTHELSNIAKNGPSLPPILRSLHFADPSLPLGILAKQDSLAPPNMTAHITRVGTGFAYVAGLMLISLHFFQRVAATAKRSISTSGNQFAIRPCASPLLTSIRTFATEKSEVVLRPANSYYGWHTLQRENHPLF